MKEFEIRPVNFEIRPVKFEAFRRSLYFEFDPTLIQLELIRFGFQDHSKVKNFSRWDFCKENNSRYIFTFSFIQPFKHQEGTIWQKEKKASTISLIWETELEQCWKTEMGHLHLQKVQNPLGRGGTLLKYYSNLSFWREKIAAIFYTGRHCSQLLICQFVGFWWKNWVLGVLSNFGSFGAGMTIAS